MKIRTRYAPSPTGRMHVGNLRTALYAYLIAKHEGGDFILRIEDTDQVRQVEGAVDIINRTLADTGLIPDESPEKDGGVGPYVQSERVKAGIYDKYAKELIDRAHDLGMRCNYFFCDDGEQARRMFEQEFDAVFRAWVAQTRTHRAPGLISSLYAPKDDADIQPGERVFYTRENAILLDSARRALDAAVPARYFELLLAPLLAEASVHANTSGVFKGFYKDRRGIGTFGGEGKNALSRICGEVELRKPVLSRFSCDSVVLRGDANEVAQSIEPVDLAYFDPPYNQHPYGSNYFMLNLLVENRVPASVSKVSGIPEGWNHSRYNQRQEAETALFALLASTPAKFLMVSYNSEGFIPQESFMCFLGQLGEVTPFETEYSTFRGSRNLRQRPLKVTERLFLVQRKK